MCLDFFFVGDVIQKNLRGIMKRQGIQLQGKMRGILTRAAPRLTWLKRLVKGSLIVDSN